MDQERVERISNIKATAWTTIIVFSIAGYLVFSNYLVESLAARTEATEAGDSGKEFLVYLNRVIILSLLVCLYLFLVVYGAIGLLKLKLNGLIVYQTTTILLVVMMVAFVIYGMLYMRENYHGPKDMMKVGYYFKLFQGISYETIMIIFAWVLVKINLMLTRKEYRNEFS